MSDQDDMSLIRTYLQGNQDALAELQERYRRPLYSYLNKMLPGQSALVDDLFQSTWMKVVDKLNKYQDKQKFVSWLFRIAHNNAIDHFRKQKNRQSVDIDELQLEASSSLIPWQEISSGELGKAIEEAVDKLPDEQREVFLLRQENVAFKDIAEIQGCTLNTVLGRMHYAVNKLRTLLKDWV